MLTINSNFLSSHRQTFETHFQFPVLQRISMKISIDEDFSFTRVFLSFFILAELLIHVKVERESGIEFSAVPPRDQNETFHPTKTKIPRREESWCTDSTKEFAAEGVSPREGVNDEKRGREKMRPGHVTRQVVGGIVDAVESLLCGA